MKVIISQEEIHEAVQAYITNVLGSELIVNEITVVAGRENASRIEAELSKTVKDVNVTTEQLCIGTEVSSETKVVKVKPTIVITEPDELPVENEEVKPVDGAVQQETVETVSENVESTVTDEVKEEEVAPTVAPLKEPIKKFTGNSFFKKNTVN